MFRTVPAVAALLMALFWHDPVQSAPPRNEAAERFMDAIGLEVLLQQTMERSLEAELRQNPALVPYKEIMAAFLAKYMSYASLKPDLLKLYAEAFTDQDLADLTAFYSTPLGQKALRQLPEMAVKSAQIGSSKVAAHLDELKDLVTKEAERLKALEALQPTAESKRPEGSIDAP